MSWLFSQALVAEYSQATAWAGAPFAQLSVMPTQHKFWRNDKTMEPCDLSRFGLTCAALREDHGAALLTWFQEASRAKTSALPAEAQALKAHAAECGATWRGSLARFDPGSSTWRTAQPSLLGDSEECSVIWPRSGMTVGGLCWELPTLVPPTSATASGLWPTPTAALHWSGGSDCTGIRRPENLASAVKTWATPTARDWRSGKASQATMERNSRPLSEQVGGSLNPAWVEWLMGWPIGWTDLKPLATDKCPDAQPQLGACSLAA